MTTQQPEALRLADIVERLNVGVHSQAIAEEYSAAARELRRLHARIAELESQLAAAQQAVQDAAKPTQQGLEQTKVVAHKQLANCLEAFARYANHVGHCEGVDFIDCAFRPLKKSMPEHLWPQVEEMLVVRENLAAQSKQGE